MVLESFEQLAQRARSLPRRTVAVAAAHDAHALEAVRDAAAEGLVDYLLVGDPGEIRELAAGLAFSPDPERIIPEGDDAACAKKAVELCREGRAQLLMKGRLQTSTLLKEVVNKETGIGMGGLMSHMALFQIHPFPSGGISGFCIGQPGDAAVLHPQAAESFLRRTEGMDTSICI